MTAAEILQKHEDANEMHLHHVDRKWVIEAMEEYAIQFGRQCVTKWGLTDVDSKYIKAFHETNKGGEL